MKKVAFIYFYNDDSKTFNAFGPITKDKKTTDFTVKLQSYGLNLRISTTDQVHSIEEAIKMGPSGFTYNEKLNWYLD